MGFEYQSLATGRFQMPDGWQLTTIQKVAKVNEEAITKRNSPSHIQYIDITSLDKGKLLDIQELSFEKAPSRAKRVVKDRDTLISTVRPNLEHYLFVKEPKPNTIASTGFAVVSAKNADPRFLYYYMTSKPFTAYLTQIAESHTSAYPAFNPDIIENAELILPTDREQRAIAHILGTLDDKIELNRQMNETLEAMAQAIFKSWFVDFDPVIDKALAAGNPIPIELKEKAARRKTLGNRRKPLPLDISCLFPDSFEDSELGPIPKGWESGKVNDILEIKKDSIKPELYKNEIFNHYSIPAFDEGKIPKRENGSCIKSNKFIVPENSVLLSKLNPRIPRVWYPSIEGKSKSICSTEFLITFPKSNYNREYLYSLYNSSKFMIDFCGLVTGTSGSHQRVNLGSFLNMELLLISEKIIYTYSHISNPFFSKINENTKQNITLIQIRDTLLPKLLSGELRVNMAEKEMEKRL